MKVPYYKGKKLTRPFFRKNSGSLIIHENGFWPFLAILSSFASLLWLILHILIDKIDPQVLTVIKLLGRVINYSITLSQETLARRNFGEQIIWCTLNFANCQIDFFPSIKFREFSKWKKFADIKFRKLEITNIIVISYKYVKEGTERN